jgi:hypothetical protein
MRGPRPIRDQWLITDGRRRAADEAAAPAVAETEHGEWVREHVVDVAVITMRVATHREEQQRAFALAHEVVCHVFCRSTLACCDGLDALVRARLVVGDIAVVRAERVDAIPCACEQPAETGSETWRGAPAGRDHPHEASWAAAWRSS